jgi:D-alanine-D-alanine ligase
MKIVVLHDFIPERAPEDAQDGLVQAGEVSRSLSNLGHKTSPLFFTLDIQQIVDTLRKTNPDMVFNLVESVSGYGKLIYMSPATLDYLKIPYTGSGIDATFLTSNKVLSKKILKASGIPTPPWLTPENINDHSFALGRPYIIKSVWEHASIGLGNHSVITARSKDEFIESIRRWNGFFAGDFFAEFYIDGREFNLSLLEVDGDVDVLPVAEIRYIDYPEGKWKILDYPSKWVRESFEYEHTKRCFDFSIKDEILIGKLAEIAKQCWKIFSLRGYARVDFRVDQAENPWVLEVNTNPCLAPDSGFIASAKRADLNFDQIIKRIVDASMSLKFRF